MKNESLSRLEPCAVKVASTVLRGGWNSNGLSLPDKDYAQCVSK
jgi:hypothetical protein